MRKKISNFTFEKFVFFLFLFALALISGSSAGAQTIVSDSGNILDIKANSSLTTSTLRFVPSTSANSFSLQGIAPGATTVSIFDYLSSTSSFKMLNGTLNYNPSNNFIGIGLTNPTQALHIAGNIRVNGDIINDGNYGTGLVGLYSATRYQNVFSMGAAYRLAANGTTPNTMYGIAWTHSNIGGQSKAGLAHQALFMTNGVTQTAIGTGIWTLGGYTQTGSSLNTFSGNVGVGVSPTQKLHVAGDASFFNGASPSVIHGVGAPVTTTDAVNRFYVDGLITDLSGQIAGISSYWSANGTNIYNNNTGNVGIGISAPLAKLQINNEAAFNTLTPGPAAYYGLHFGGQTTADYATGITWSGGTSGTQAGIYVQGSGSYGSRMYFATTNSYATGAQNRMIINEGGNVGIGTTAPTKKLDVNGDFLIRNAATFSSSITASLMSGAAGRLVAVDASGTLGAITSASSGQTLRFNGSAWVPNSNIYNNGTNVGIGTSTPVQKLDVVGSVNVSTGYRINNIAANGKYLRGNGTNFVESSIQVGDVPTLNQNTAGYAGNLVYEDNRAISPSELVANRMKFGFTSYANNSSSPYADFLHFNSYGDVSGGNANLLVINKSGIGMRLYQQVFGTTTNFSAYKDVVLANNTPALNYLTKYASTGNSVTVSSSQVYDNGTRVGVGTTAPSHKLHVAGEGNFNSNQIHGVSSPTVATDVANKGYVDSAVSGGGGTSYWSANGDDIYNNNINFVGIGNQIPIARLHVGDRNFDSFDSNTDGPKDAEIISRGNMIVGAVDFESSGYIGVVGLKKSERSGAGFTGMKADVNGGDDNIETNLNFLTSKGSDSRARMIIDYNGDVGIGVGAPSAKLDVAGSGKFVSGTAAVPGVMIGAVNSGIFSPSAGQIAITTSGRNTATFVSSSATDVRFQINTTNYSTMFGQYEGNWYGVTNPLIIQPLAPATAHDIAITGVQNSPLSGIVIKSNGRIGIGVTAPDYKLDVLGEANFYGNQIHNVGIPTAGTDAVNKNYVDSVSSGSNWTANGNNIYNSNTGNVGLGTSAPGQQLEITKNFKLPTSTGVTAGVIFKGNDRFLYSVPSTGNIFMGTNSGNFTTWIGGTGNIGIGNEALNSLSATPSAAPNSNDDNVALGHTALKLNTTGYYNVGVGSKALTRNTNGHDNVAMGYDALSLNTTGYDNVAIGSQAGVYHASSSADYANIMIGARAAVAPGRVNSIAIGTGAFASSTNEVRIGNSNTTFNFLYGNVWAINGSFDTYSDSRLKHDVYSLGDADYRKILALRPVSFSWNSNNSKGIGFIAQEVEKLYPEVISVDPGTGMKGISYAELISPTIAALQAQQKKIDEQDTLIRILLDRVNRLEKDIKR